MKEVEGGVNSLKINNEETLVCSEWRRLIRGTVGDSDVSGVLMCLIVFAIRPPGLSWKRAIKW